MIGWSLTIKRQGGMSGEMVMDDKKRSTATRLPENLNRQGGQRKVSGAQPWAREGAEAMRPTHITEKTLVFSDAGKQPMLRSI